MSYYSNQTNMKNYIPSTILQQLTDDNSTDRIDTEKMNYALKQATDLIDSYLRGRYTVPLDNVPEMISDLCTKLAVYYLFQRTFIVTMPDPIKDQYKECVDILKQIQQGKISPFTSEPTFFDSNKGSEDRIFISASTTMTNTNQMSWGAYRI